MSAMEQARRDFTIRGAEQGDLTAIVEIDKEVSGAKKLQFWRDALELYRSHKGKAFFLVAERQHHIAGFILGEIRAWEFGSPPCGWVYAIGVARANLLEGVGTKLLDALCAHFQKANVDKVRTMIARQDHELLSFFRSYGMMAGPYQQLELEIGSL